MPQSIGPSCGELSSRYLPDLSDASSFQIPLSDAPGNYLLADDSGDFFQGAVNDVTPASSRTAQHHLLTLSQVTPSVIPTLDESRLPIYSPKTVNMNPKYRNPPSKTAKVNTDAQSQRLPFGGHTARMDALINEVKSLEDDSSREHNNDPSIRFSPKGNGREKEPLEERKTRKSTRKPKSAVMDGGVTKQRNRNKFPSGMMPSPRSTQELSSVKIFNGPSERAFHDEHMDPNISASFAVDGVAERLVMYGQKLIGSFRTTNSDNMIEPTADPTLTSFQTTSAHDSRPLEFQADDEMPLTVSQLSPSKPTISRGNVRTPSVVHSPPRSSTKRPASVTAESQPPRKREKHMPSGTESATINLKLARTHAALCPPTTSKGAIQPISAGLNSKSTKRATSRVKAKEVTKKGPVMIRDEFDPKASNASSPMAKEISTSLAGKALQGAHTKKLGNSVPMRGSRKRVTTATVSPIILPDSEFQLNGRMEAPTKDDREPSLMRKPGSLHIPDFKALHAVHEAELSRRKENIHPTIPVPPMFETDRRVKERQKFDERMKEKERELEKVREQRRREREEEEAREIKELRKKAIPKANEVPDWYKEAPKRTGK